ncbi:MAG: ATP-dependent sacrificial sulfur transferase LarE [Acidimicrobiales bacterium]
MGDLGGLKVALSELDRVVVAFSGGADSAFLAQMATQTLGPGRALCATAISASLAPEEEADCRALADEWGLNWRPVRTEETANPAYVANDGLRCFHCKSELMAALEPLAAETGAVVVLGVNLDDLEDYRPGQRAATERGAVFPLVQAGFTKHDVRTESRRLGLRTWDKPAAACLASRVPYGTAVTLSVLGTVAKAESALRALGFSELRVRHYNNLARVELGESELARALRMRLEIVEALRQAGYEYATLDLAGLRSGNLNRALDGEKK